MAGPGKKQPYNLQAAIRRGTLEVNIPAAIITVAIWIIGRAVGTQLFHDRTVISTVVSVIAGFVGTWLWWSYRVPRWRRWALRQGIPPDELQAAAQAAMLVWPKGSFFEKTEFKVKDE